MPHEISMHLGTELRDLALYLNNEKHMTSDALILVDAMQGVFAELADLSEVFKTDSGILNDLIHEKKESDEIIKEMEDLKKEAEEIIKYPVGKIRITNFTERVKKLNWKLSTTGFAEDPKEDRDLRERVRTSLCYLARNVAIELNNTKHQPSSALIIAEMLRDEFIDIISLQDKLIVDCRLLRQQAALENSSRYSSYPGSSRYRSSTTSNESGCLTVFGIVLGVALLIGLIVYFFKL